MYRSIITVFDKIRGIGTDKCNLYISDGYCLQKTSNKETSELMNMREFWGFVFEKDGMWVNYDLSSDKSGMAKFFDIYNKNISYPELETGASGHYSYANKEIIGAKVRYLFKISKEDGSVTKHKGRYHLGVAVFDKKIFARDKNEGLVCYDYDFEKLWNIEVEKKIFNDIYSGPQNYNNLIILNAGENADDERGEFELNAYSANDGSLVWQVIMETCPYSSNVIGGKVYISVDDKIMIIDAATGKTLLDKPHKFNRNTHHLLYPYKDLLLAISEPDSKIHVFDQEGNLKQQITMPEGYMPSHVGYPVEYDGKLYSPLILQNMLMRGTSSVLLTLTPDETAPEKINLELPPRPPFYISVITTKKDEHEHVVTISHDNLEEIILYATINLKEIGLETSDSVNMSQRDAKHNGTLRLVVDPEPLADETDTLKKLQIVKEKVEWFLKSQHETAGDNQNDYKVIIELK